MSIKGLYTSIDEDNHRLLLGEYLPLFSSDFQKKVKSYYRWQDAQLSILGRMLLLRGAWELGLAYDWNAIRYTVYHKPFFIDDQLKFNISHSGEMVVCVMTKDAEIGVDIEKIVEIPLLDFRNQMTEAEWLSVLRSRHQIPAFFDYWTKKEAAIKANGKGLHISLNSFEISDEKCIIADQPYWIEEIHLNKQYKCNIALSTPIRKDVIELVELPSDFITRF